MKVLYDASVLGAARISQKGRTGVYRVVNEIARYLIARDDIDLSWTAFGNHNHLDDVIEMSRSDPEMAAPVVASIWRRHCLDLLAKPLNRIAASHLYRLVAPILPAVDELKKRATFNEKLLEGFDVLHSPFGKLPDGEPGKGPVRVITVYDLIAIRFPSLFENGISLQIEATIQSILPSDWVLCISEATRLDLLDYRRDLNPDRVRVTPLAAGDCFRPCEDEIQINQVRIKYGIPAGASYFLSVCTLEPRKNLRHLIRVFERNYMAFPQNTYLVLVGATGWHLDELMRDIESSPIGRVLPTGYVPDEDLAPLYSGAIAFVYVSLYEGFGLPPLEAMKCGTPTITSDNSSLPEVVGDAGIMVPANCEESLAAAMQQLASAPEVCTDLSQKGLDRALLFSWERCGQQTVQTYYDAIETRE
ncbi:glycosyltransferase family 4 protein [Neorhodopirellula pilleata]|uniref:D-inositol 3-phosphate glycosyltransferase n=1 Tax=Neorhodopirellula pilleata TaxID=2714738 RepID=A0A5C6APB4_9BACT|nr:glycosyltransferase family 1 protein [Neorhodopirellula pilleata]TWU01348.1 D-inositol 3-phosphate glycosyltransferase [Neorhodopirellula pilleata]